MGTYRENLQWQRYDTLTIWHRREDLLRWECPSHLNLQPCTDGRSFWFAVVTTTEAEKQTTTGTLGF